MSIEYKKPTSLKWPQKKVVVLTSGGLDSTCLLAWLRSEDFLVNPIAFDYKSKHNDAEFKALCEVCFALGLEDPIRIPIHFINEFFRSNLLSSGGAIPQGHYEEKNMSQTVVPGRNSIMLSIAAGLAESRGYSFIAIANHFGDHAIYPDCRASFIRAMAETIRLSSDGKVHLLAPFSEMMKWDIVKLGSEIGAPLASSYSCYEGDPTIHCGKCGTCVERIEAFIKARVEDPTNYIDKDYALKILASKR